MRKNGELFLEFIQALFILVK